MNDSKNDILKSIRGELIVSCQALPGEPLYVEEKSVMYLMARAAVQAGARCIRTSGVRDVAAIKKETGLPVIGLIKRRYEGYEAIITPTMKEIGELVDVHADIIALDCTGRKRGDNLTIQDFLRQIRSRYPGILLMGDISTYEEGIHAWKCGVDFIGTTLSGYTENSPKSEEPDYDLVERLASSVDIPVIAEGRIRTPEQAALMLKKGAYAVVVGGAITRPLEIAGRFIKAMKPSSETGPLSSGSPGPSEN